MNTSWAELRDEDGNVLFSDHEGFGDVLLTELDPGAPTPRGVTNDFPNKDGALDTSVYFSARAVALTFSCGSNEAARRNFLTSIMPLCKPSRRPVLVVNMPEWGDDPWRMVLRADSFTAPLTIGSEIDLSWQAPAGVWESESEISQQVNPAVGTPGGMVFPVTLPMTFGVGSSPSAEILTVGGVVPTPPKVFIYGPITDPAIALQNTSQKIQFTSTIAAGDYYEIDVDAGTILENSDASASRYGSVDWSVSDFWLLQPGDNQIALTGTGMSSVTQAVVTWRDRRL